MDFLKETGPESVDSSLGPHNSKSLADILTDINQNVQRMLSLINDNNEPESTEKFLCLYQSLGERYYDLNQELLKGFFTFDTKLSCSDHNNASSAIVTPMGLGRTTRSEMTPSLKLNGEIEKKNESGYLIADIFCAELETARRELEGKNVDIETEKRRVFELESKLLDSSCKIEILESELEVTRECLEVSEAEASKLMEMFSFCKAEKEKLQTDNASGLVDSLRAEWKSREIQTEQMEEYLNQVCIEDTEIMSESGTNKNVVEEELRARVEELEKQVDLQRNVISETEQEKREAIRELCFSLDHYKSRFIELVRALADHKKVCLVK